MKAKDLRIKTIEELKKLENDLRKKMQEYLILKKIKKLDKPYFLRQTKKDLARVLTVINEKLKQK